MADQAKVDEPTLKALGARGLVRPSPKDLQVVLGPIADEVAREMREALAGGGAVDRSGSAPGAAPSPVIAVDANTAAGMLAALGGAHNLTAVEAAANRLLVGVADHAGVDEPALRALGVRAVARTGAASVQLILAEDAAALGTALVSVP